MDGAKRRACAPRGLDPAEAIHSRPAGRNVNLVRMAALSIFGKEHYLTGAGRLAQAELRARLKGRWGLNLERRRKRHGQFK